MDSLINLDRYKEKKQWGGYVLECTKDNALYIGMSCNLDNRMREHMRGGKQSSRFLTRYGGPVRVLELHFCETEEQARHWEDETSWQLFTTYKDRPVYHLGYRDPIRTPTPSRIKERVIGPTDVPLLSKQSMDAWARIFKRNTKHRNKQPN